MQEFLRRTLSRGKLSTLIISMLGFCGLVCSSFLLYPPQGSGITSGSAPAPAPQNTEVAREVTIKPSIRTIQFVKEEIQNVPPMVMLNTNSPLRIRFDDMDGSYRNYWYMVTYCDAEWRPTTLLASEYIDGVFQEQVVNYAFSNNTYIKYTHYWFDFPSASMQPKFSGNYLLTVFEDETTNVVFSRRIYVYETDAGTTMDIHRPSYPRFRDTKQEVDFSVNIQDLQALNPFQNIKVVVRQNQRWDNAIYGLKPAYIRDNLLVYNYEEENLMDGNNEWRAMDLRDIRFKGMGVRYFQFQDTIWHAVAMGDQDRSYQAYTFYPDQNGTFTIHTRQTPPSSNYFPQTEADYIMTHFIMKPTYYDENKDIYLFGGLSNWQLDPRFKMTYNARDRQYECNVMLKQGYYDYMYATVNREAGEVSLTELEGNHWQTENNYMVLTYYRPQHLAIDRLVGIQLGSSNPQ